MPRAGSIRWVICLLLFLSVAVSYIDRNLIAILKMPLSGALGWNEPDYASIAAAFQIAYAFGYLFGGRMMDRMGVKRAFPLIVLLWSAATVAHGLCVFIPADLRVSLRLPLVISTARAAGWTLPATVVGFAAAQLALGLAEGGNFPGAIKTVAEWYPVSERALATGLFNVGTNVGAIICPLAAPLVFRWWSWPIAFYAAGGLGIVWVAAWWWLYDPPEKHRWLGTAERAYIRSGRAVEDDRGATMPWQDLIRSRPVWAYLIASVLAGPVWGVYMFFLPDFLSSRYHLGLMAVGIWTAVFYLVASVGGVAGGWLPARLLGRGWSLNAARKGALLVCALAAVPVFLAPHVPVVWVTVLVVGVAGSANQGWAANLFSFVSDTMPPRAISSVVGLGGFVGSMAGAAASEAIGWVLETTHSYAPIFAAASLMYLVSLGVLHLLVPVIGRPASLRLETAGRTGSVPR